MNLLLAVSGGIDSMYLAHRASEFYPGASFAVAHCNFCLRGAESDGDETFVRTWCEISGMRCFTVRFDTMGKAAASGRSIEMEARELRYGWFTELCRREGFDAVVVAHNANDNAETLMLNLLRGTGLKGIRGMAARSTREDGLEILRPMLGITREEITLWMTSRGLVWREDSTNSESIAKRNILRNEVFPLLQKINPGFLRTLETDMENFAQADDITEEYFEKCGVRLEEKGIPVDRLLSLNHWEFVLWRLLESCGIKGPTFKKMTLLLEKYRSGPRGTVTLSGKTFQTSTHLIKAVKGRLVISKK